MQTSARTVKKTISSQLPRIGSPRKGRLPLTHTQRGRPLFELRLHQRCHATGTLASRNKLVWLRCLGSGVGCLVALLSHPAILFWLCPPRLASTIQNSCPLPCASPSPFLLFPAFDFGPGSGCTAIGPSSPDLEAARAYTHLTG